MSAQVKVAYINFLNHCYVDTEVEMKEIYTSNHMWKLFENFLVDICRVRRCVRTRLSVRLSVCGWAPCGDTGEHRRISAHSSVAQGSRRGSQFSCVLFLPFTLS